MIHSPLVSDRDPAYTTKTLHALKSNAKCPMRIPTLVNGSCLDVWALEYDEMEGLFTLESWWCGKSRVC